MSLISVLNTKINSPRLSQPRILRRSRLLLFYEECKQFPLILVSATAGYGKTTYLLDLVQGIEANFCWYSLDDSDRDPAVFCTYLLNSIRQVYPNFGKSFENLLIQNLSDLHQETIITRLAEEFIFSLEQIVQDPNFKETIIILDDYQFAESFGVSRFLERIIWWLPADYHIILSTRSVPENLALTRLVAKQKLAAIGQDELAFTPDEIRELLNIHNVYDLELIDVLTQYSQGWVTAIVLTISNKKLISSGGWRKLLTNERFAAQQIFDYLAQEVIKNQSKKIQDFLLKTSVLEVLRPTECARLLDHTKQESEEILQQLENLNLFITRFDSYEENYEETYQYHTLFRKFLLLWLKKDSSSYHKIELKAAFLSIENKDYAQAVQHFVEAEAYREAAHTLNEIAEPLYLSGRASFLSELLGLIPIEEQNTYPHLLNVRARLLLESGHHEASLQIYTDAERLFRKENALHEVARVLANQAQILWRIGRRDDSKLLCNQILSDEAYCDLMETIAGKQAVALAKSILASIAIDVGDDNEAEEYLQDAAEIYKTLGDEYRLASIDNNFGRLYQRLGKLTKSSLYYEKALKYCVKSGNRIREAYTRTSLANNYYLQGHFQQAEAQLDETLILTENFRDDYLKVFVLSILANIYRDTQRFPKANESYTAALELARSSNVRNMVLELLNDRAFCLILQGRIEEAEIEIKETLQLSEDYNLKEKKGFAFLNLAHIRFLEKSYKRTLTNAEAALNVFLESKLQSGEIRARLYLSFTYYKLGELKKALNELSQSIELCSGLGYEPFLPPELDLAVSIFEYASHKKVGDNLENYLRKRGFISDTQEAVSTSDTEINSKLILIPNNTKQLTLSVATSSEILAAYSLAGGEVYSKGKLLSWRTNKARELFFFLLEKGKSTREEIIDSFWPEPDYEFESASNLLRTNTMYIRKAISPFELKYEAGQYYIDADYWLDATEFEKVVKFELNKKQNNIDIERLSKTLSLYKRDYLKQFYTDWVIERQLELSQLHSRGVVELARLYMSKGQYQQAVDAYNLLLVKDPYNEDAHEAIINCLLAIDNKTEARHQVEKYKQTLRELDLEPTPQAISALKKFA